MTVSLRRALLLFKLQAKKYHRYQPPVQSYSPRKHGISTYYQASIAPTNAFSHFISKRPPYPNIPSASPGNGKTTDKMSLSNCRFYEEKYPEIDSFVMVNVKQVGCGSSHRPYCGVTVL